MTLPNDGCLARLGRVALPGHSCLLSPNGALAGLWAQADDGSRMLGMLSRAPPKKLFTASQGIALASEETKQHDQDDEEKEANQQDFH